MQGFTSIAESLSPEALTAHMAVYFEEMLKIVKKFREEDAAAAAKASPK